MSAPYKTESGPEAYGPAEFAAEFNVSRETMDRLTAYDAALMEAAKLHNLMAPSTIPVRWARHYRDSAQLFALLPQAQKSRPRRLVDIGSGAGFPGLVLAAMGADGGLKVDLVESVGKKARFLAEAGAAMGLANLAVWPQRVENTCLSPPDVITARALAPLERLLGYAVGLANEKTLLLFPKGQDVADELTAAAKSWHMEVESHPSLTNPGSTILAIRNLRRKPVGRNAGGGSQARRSAGRDRPGGKRSGTGTP